jgi:signal transduction histidine kinase
MHKNHVSYNYNRKKLELLGLIAGGIAHDLNNILTGISGYIELARSEVTEGTPVYTYLQEACKTCSIAGEMLKEIFVSTMEIEEEIHELHILPVIKESLNLFKMSLPYSIKIREYIDVSSDTVRANKSHIYHILNNLFTNAFQSIGDKEGIIDVYLVEMKDYDIYMYSDLKEGNYLKLTVKDNGCGIKQEHLEHIFEPFFTTKTYKKGKGIGLALVRNIIDNLGGGIFVRSKEGEYTIFDVLLPMIPFMKECKKENSGNNIETGRSIPAIDHEQDHCSRLTTHEDLFLL